MDYIILQAKTIEDLQKLVIDAMNKKYTICGGVSNSYNPVLNTIVFYQAVQKIG